MKKISMYLVILLVLSTTIASGQLFPFKKEFSNDEIKKWIITNLATAVLWENNSHSKPTFYFKDSAFHISFQNGSINNVPVTIDYSFSIKKIDYLYEMDIIMNENSDSGEGFIVFTRNADNLYLYLNVNRTKIPDEVRNSFIVNLNYAFEKLRGLYVPDYFFK